MGRPALHQFVAALIVVLASLLAAPAAANGFLDQHDEPSFSPQCHAASGLETSFEDIAQSLRGSGRWTCEDSN